MTTVIRVIDNPTPEKIRVGDYVTLERIGHKGVQVRGTVFRWDPVYADWLAIAGWANQRFAIDGGRVSWTVARIQREETVPHSGVPFSTGYATVERKDERPHGEWGIYLHGQFYAIDRKTGDVQPWAPWSSFDPGLPSR